MNVTISNSYKKLHERLIAATALAGAYFPIKDVRDALTPVLDEITVIEFEQTKVVLQKAPQELPPLPVGTFVMSNGKPSVWDGEDFAPVQSYLDDQQDELRAERASRAREIAGYKKTLEPFVDEFRTPHPIPPACFGEVRVTSEGLQVRREDGRRLAVQDFINELRGGDPQREVARFRKALASYQQTLKPFVDEKGDLPIPPARFGEVRIVDDELQVYTAEGRTEGVQKFIDDQIHRTTTEGMRGDGLAADLAAAVASRDKHKAEESRVQKLLTECQASREDWHKKAESAHNREQRLIERAELAEQQLKDANSLIVKQLAAIKDAQTYWFSFQPVGFDRKDYPYAYLLEGVEE